jgi:MFS transporter, ACS family, allantoate permease
MSTMASTSSDEKLERSSASEISISKGDEALQLVGVERTTEFSEEYNRRLRRKLVSASLTIRCFCLLKSLHQDLLIPPLCASVYFTQFL